MPLQRTEADIAATIDHAILKPQFTTRDVDAELDVAAEWGVFSVCVRPSDIAHAVRRLDGTRVAVGTVIGFPHGTTSSAAKAAEVVRAREDGASEFDMVIHIGALIGGETDRVLDDIRAFVASTGTLVSKVILETSLLTEEQIALGSRLVDEGGATFVKTSTGFAGGGATVPHVGLMRDNVTDKTQVKASGGVRGYESALEMLDAGATRLGTSASATILGEARARDAGEQASAGEDESSY